MKKIGKFLQKKSLYVAGRSLQTIVCIQNFRATEPTHAKQSMLQEV
jgi:hypothetical protein